MLQPVESLVLHRQADTIITVAASATVAEAVDVMAAREVGAVLVKNEEQLFAGIFSERDLLVRVVQAGRDPKRATEAVGVNPHIPLVPPGAPREGGGAGAGGFTLYGASGPFPGSRSTGSGAFCHWVVSSAC